MPHEPPFRHLEAAYQLHVYLCLKTHYLRPLFASDEALTTIRHGVDDVCNRHRYHLLDIQLSADHLRLLLSLKPDQTISRAVQMLKGNISRQFSLKCGEELARHRTKSPWAEGYFARSSGKADLATVRRYVEEQADHHGYRGEWTSGLSFRNSQFRSPAFYFDHCVCILGYHIVLVTKFRTPLLDDYIAPRLFEYVVAMGGKRGFAVDRIGAGPDHVHLIIEARPDVSVADCALSLVNNTRYWMENNYWGVLKETGCWDVWQPSFYAGTVGEYSTAQIRQFLG
jgi:putative transposase